MAISPDTKALDPQETEISLSVAMWGEILAKVWNERTKFSGVKGAGEKERAKRQLSSFSLSLDISLLLDGMCSVLCLASSAQRAKCKVGGARDHRASPSLLDHVQIWVNAPACQGNVLVKFFNTGI